MDLMWKAGEAISYAARAKNRHGIHSPFVYRLLDEVIYDREDRPGYAMVEQVRQQLMNRQDTVSVTDLGAGSHVNGSDIRKVSDIARHSAKSGKWGRLLFRLARHLQPRAMLELGTSLGVSTQYQCLGNPEGSMTTLEGCPDTAAIARQQFMASGLKQVHVVEGNFDQTLPQVLRGMERLDWAFIDGNHRKEPTLRYFGQCLEKCHVGSVLLFDDIHWSRGMAEAWEQIKAHPKVSVTLDLFQTGIVFLRKGQAKEDFVIRY